ncbi:MAG: carbon-nitrogen hydrolase [Desulfuromonadia bacterium]
MNPTIALAQTKPKLGALITTIDSVCATIHRAIDAGAHLVVFPELALTGYLLKDLISDVALPLDSPLLKPLFDLSRRIAIVVGMVEASPDRQYYNSALFLEGGELRHRHRKVYLPTYGLFDEQRYSARGGSFRSFDTRFGRVGMLICEDMWHLSAPYLLAMDGAMTLICLSSSPARGVGDGEGLGSAAAWQRLNGLIARFLTVRVVYVNRVGVEDGLTFWGGSEVVEPDGSLAARGPLFDEDLVVVSCRDDLFRRSRILNPLLRDEDIHLTLKELSRIERERSV